MKRKTDNLVLLICMLASGGIVGAIDVEAHLAQAANRPYSSPPFGPAWDTRLKDNYRGKFDSRPNSSPDAYHARGKNARRTT